MTQRKRRMKQGAYLQRATKQNRRAHKVKKRQYRNLVQTEPMNKKKFVVEEEALDKEERTNEKQKPIEAENNRDQ